MKITEGMAELIGSLIGDGYIYRAHRKYQIGFVGSPKTDREYFRVLQKLISTEWKKEAKIKFRERGLRIVINSKEISLFLINKLKIPYGDGKCEKIKIPEKIFKNWKLVRNTLRGIVDTDGSVFFARKPGIEKYPSLEITTVSKQLAGQIRDILIKRGFRVAKIWSYKTKTQKRVAYKIPLNGKKNIQKWVDEIGFSNSYKLRRAVAYSKR